MSCCICLDINEQAVVTSCTGSKSVANGPGCEYIGCCVSVEKRGAIVLGKDEFVLIYDDASGQKRVEDGKPDGKVVWMNEMDRCEGGGPQKAVNLTIDQYLVYENTANGERHVVCGEMMFVPGAFDIPSGNHHSGDFASCARSSYNLAKNQYLRIKDENGVLKIIIGERRFIPGPHDECMAEDFWMQETEGAPWKKTRGVVQTAINVDVHTAVMVRDISNGNLTQHHQPGLFFPSDYQQVEMVQEKTVLQVFERMAYIDQTGHTTFKSGEHETNRNFFLPPFCKWVTQEWSTDIRKEHKQTQLMKVFDVRPQYMKYQFSCRTVDNVELVVDVSFYWKVMDMEKMVMQTADAPGDICTHARSGIIQSVANKTLLQFIGGFNEIVRDGAGVLELTPSEKDERCRALEAKKTNLEGDMRRVEDELQRLREIDTGFDESADDVTRQNLTEGGKDLDMMNAELKGIRADIEKMSSPENIVDSFYKDRGVDLMSVEVLTFKCSNPDTDKTLQEIIKETADRLKNIEKAKGENQVAMTKMQGEIELQGKNAELIKIKKSHMIIEQDIEGRAEAAKITAFVSALAHPALIPNPTGQGPRIAAHPEVDIKHATELFTINRKLDSLQTLAQGNATMYISHKDVNLVSGDMAFNNSH